MQPYTVAEQVAASEALTEGMPTLSRLHNHDLFNFIAIVVGWSALLLMVPPQHEYPVIDDWIYAGSVRDMLNTGRFIMPDMSQANLAGLTVWGALWTRLFGFSFTTLTYSTLVMALACLHFFYGIARTLNVPPWGALLGTALLAFNPIFFHLSYSFMTDVPFLALMLGSCYCYLKALPSEGRRAIWFLAGGFLAGWAYTVRQFGVLVPLSFGAYLLFEGLINRKLRWREIVAVAAVPAIFFVGWYLFSRNTPIAATVAAAGSRSANFIMKEPWLRVTLLRAFTLMPLLALFAWGAVRMRRISWLATIPVALLIASAAYAVDLPGETWLAATEQPFTVRLGPLAFEHPNEAYTFGNVGNIIRVGGIDFFEYDQERIWSPEAWRALWVLGAVLAVVLLVKMGESLAEWFPQLRKERTIPPASTLYLLGALIFAVSVAFPGDLFDRYSLAFIPFIILFVVRGSRNWGRIAWAYSLVALGLLSFFTVLAKLDHIDHDNARWQAGHWMQARTGAVHVGFDWDYWVGASSDIYRVADISLPGFRTEQSFSYTCRLCGFTSRQVLAQSQIAAPPLLQPSTLP